MAKKSKPEPLVVVDPVPVFSLEQSALIEQAMKQVIEGGSYVEGIENYITRDFILCEALRLLRSENEKLRLDSMKFISEMMGFLNSPGPIFADVHFDAGSIRRAGRPLL